MGRMLNQVSYIEEETNDELDIKERIIVEKQKEFSKRPVYGSKSHYSGQKRKYEELNDKIQDACSKKKLYQIDIDVSEEARNLVGSDAHFVGHIAELVTMNFLLKDTAKHEFVNIPQFSLNTFDTNKDIVLITPQGDQLIEVKAETPVFRANGISFPSDQKKKMFQSDQTFVMLSGPEEYAKHWLCGVLWRFELKKMPTHLWLDYPIGAKGKPKWRFGHGMGKAPSAHSPWATPVMKVPKKIAVICSKYTPSQFVSASKYGQMSGKTNFVDSEPMEWEAYVRNQIRRHNNG